MRFRFIVGVSEGTHILVVVLMLLVVVFMLLVVILMFLVVVIMKHGARRYFIVFRIETAVTVGDVKTTDITLKSRSKTFTVVTCLLFSRKVGDSLFNIGLCDSVIDNVNDAAACPVTVQERRGASNNFDLLNAA